MRSALGLLAGGVLLALVSAASAQAGQYWAYACGQYGNALWSPSSTSPAIRPSSQCPGTGLKIQAVSGAKAGAYGRWVAQAPTGLSIAEISAPGAAVQASDVNDKAGYGGGWFYAGGGQGQQSCVQCGYTSPRLSSSYAGFQLACGWKSCTNGAYLQVGPIGLLVQESAGPVISADGANNLWYQRGWVRGRWPITFSAVDPSGVCATEALVDGQALFGPGAAPNPTAWQQCPQLTDTQALNTDLYANGQGSLTLAARNAAGNLSAPSKSIYIDNDPVGLTLSGPTEAPSTAGTQYVTATATAGPSGVRGIACSLDGAPYRTYPGASAQVPVTGLGTHHVLCVASNNAIDFYGRPAASPTESWSLSIREPTAIAATFAHVVLRCSHHVKRVYVSGRRVKAHRHGKVLYLHRRGHFRGVKVLRCHAVLLDTNPSKRIAFGARTTISGWLRTSDGTALGGQAVRVITAPDNGAGQFSPVVSATTGADGSWSATLPPGPSRLVEAAYAGSGTAASSTSGPIHIVVPAAVQIAISPQRTHWGATIAISGRLGGGGVPPAGELVVLRIGWSSGSTEIGHLYAGADGRFATKYTFLRGNGTQTYRLWAETAAESDYPYAPASSGKVRVSVGP